MSGFHCSLLSTFWWTTRKWKHCEEEVPSSKRLDMEAFWRREKPEAFRHVIRLCARADSSQGIFIFFEVNLKKNKTAGLHINL